MYINNIEGGSYISLDLEESHYELEKHEVDGALLANANVIASTITMDINDIRFKIGQ